MKEIDKQVSRESRIESIRRRILAGEYKVGAAELAQALIERMEKKQRRAA